MDARVPNRTQRPAQHFQHSYAACAPACLLQTPETRGSILAGITRASLLTLAAAKGYRTEEAPITVQEALQVRSSLLKHC